MELISAGTSGSTWGIVVGEGSGIFGSCIFKPQWNLETFLVMTL